MVPFGKSGGTLLLARRTTDWDYGYKTNWWYVICEGSITFDSLSKSSRKPINEH